MAECKHCRQEFNAKRSTSLYCSPKCKQEFYRNRIKPVTVTSVTLKPKPVTVSDSVTNAKPVTGTERGEDIVEFDNVEALLDDLHDTKPKRGKDIKVFADLPPHVQQTIDMMSTTDGKLDQTIKANRTAIAINYQHQFPDRYHSTGVV